MNLRRCSISLLPILFALAACETKKSVVPGIPLELAVERKNTIQNVKYNLFFDIPPSRTDSIPARATISFNWKKTPADLQLDFLSTASSIKSILVNGNAVKIRYESEHILIDADQLKNGSNAITIDFTAGEAALNRHDDYLYTLFVPSRASTCFPVFDQPDLKAIYRLELLLPASWKAVSNGKITSTEIVNDKKRLRFSDTKPTSSYQFAFAVGNFQEATDPVSGMTMYYRETDSIKVARNVARIFELHRQSLVWLKEYTGIDYPYEKFDFALMPAFQFGGMEHPGNIFYRESSLFLEPSASINEEMGRASLIAHETAHMWFGNLVTMQWFNDVWLKEVFANFMAAKMVSPSFPTLNHELRFLLDHYPSAYEIDRSRGAHPIQQPLDNLRNAGSVYGAIIYQKAPIMMRNLEAWMGEDNFQLGLRDYLTTYAYKNATWDDLVASLKKYTQQDLETWNNAWIKTGGMPEIAVTQATDGKFFLAIANDTSGIVWPQTVEYKIKTKYIDIVQKVTFRNSSKPLLTKWVESNMIIIPNYKGKGYGYFHSSPEFLLAEIPKQNDTEVRAGMWMNVWEIFLRGELDPVLLMNNLIGAIETESDPLLLVYLADKLTQTYWQFLTPAHRALMGKNINDHLFKRLIIEKDNSIKRTLFNTYRAASNTPEGNTNLKKLWTKEITVGLELSERDYIQLAYALALREADGYQEVLKQQLSKITNPDRIAEMEFVIPALSPDPAIRDQFFQSLSDKKNRTHEPWVLQGLRLLHHPLRAEHSVRYVKTSLMMLEELQRTGDIFFPKAWLDATLGEYQSGQAADAVREYLKENSGLRQDLRNKLLQSSDMLFRAEEIVKKNTVITPK